MAERSDRNKRLRYRFGPDRRLKKKADFARVYLDGSRAVDENLVVIVHANQAPKSRLGVSVGKKLGSAVRRNHYKRTLREAFRLTQHALPTGFDYVLIPRPQGQASTRRYRQSLIRLSPKAVRRCQQSRKSN